MLYDAKMMQEEDCSPKSQTFQVHGRLLSKESSYA